MHACRYPDEEAGQLPMAVVVRHPKSTLEEAEVGKQVLCFLFLINLFFLDFVGAVHFVLFLTLC